MCDTLAQTFKDYRRHDTFADIVTCLQPKLYAFAHRMLHDHDEAQDVVQECMVRIWMHIDKYDADKPFITWVYAICSHLCLDALKQRKRYCPLEDTAVQIRDTEQAERNLERKDIDHCLKVATATLSPKQKLVFTLCELEELSIAEVCGITHLSYLQVKSNRYWAKKSMIKQLKKMGIDGKE
ncbi:sigma-70 family RNA polymerase sigma factor [Porphyromonas pogonae]|uniref:RNA polymerase sigma factor n=1 Tax=Porphyromonas pogonae TaxID=867595 RepID=UPI002E77D585|nr:sigma-70 family RNA polymerase sigma factor [Porphyromonas pogonae]